MSLLQVKSSSNRSVRTQRLLCNPDSPCSFTGYQCSLARVEGFEYCFRHILEDKSAPTRQCRFMYPSSKRCFRSALLGDRKESFCPEHSRLAWKKRQKASMKKKLPPNAENCLDQLAHHQINNSVSFLSNNLPDPSSIPSVASTAMICDTPDEDIDSLLQDFDVRLLPRPEDDSEMDSADSETDPLEHAGVFTTEEVSRIYLEKLRRMKELYSGEYKRLLFILKEARQEYLKSVKNEKETMGSIHSQPKSTAEERESYDELKFLAKFHRRFGKEALLQKQSVDRRFQAGECTSTKPIGPSSKCIYSEGSWRCGVKSVPLSKYCFKHILQDERQVLYRACACQQPGDEECQVPVLPIPPQEPTCVYHTRFPSLPALSEILPSNATTGENLSRLHPKIVDFSENSSFVISEISPENVMEGDTVDVVGNAKQSTLSEELAAGPHPPA